MLSGKHESHCSCRPTEAIVNPVLIQCKLRPLLPAHDHENYGRDTLLRAVVHEHVRLQGSQILHLNHA